MENLRCLEKHYFAVFLWEAVKEKIENISNILHDFTQSIKLDANYLHVLKVFEDSMFLLERIDFSNNYPKQAVAVKVVHYLHVKNC